MSFGANKFKFQIDSIRGRGIEIGVVQRVILNDGANPVMETRDLWLYWVLEGVKFHPGRGEDPYGTREILAGDTITMNIEQGAMNFRLNDESLGVAYEDENLMGDDLIPFVWLNEGDSVTIL